MLYSIHLKGYQRRRWEKKEWSFWSHCLQICTVCIGEGLHGSPVGLRGRKPTRVGVAGAHIPRGSLWLLTCEVSRSGTCKDQVLRSRGLVKTFRHKLHRFRCNFLVLRSISDKHPQHIYIMDCFQWIKLYLVRNNSTTC